MREGGSPNSRRPALVVRRLEPGSAGLAAVCVIYLIPASISDLRPLLWYVSSSIFFVDVMHNFCVFCEGPDCDCSSAVVFVRLLDIRYAQYIDTWLHISSLSRLRFHLCV